MKRVLVLGVVLLSLLVLGVSSSAVSSDAWIPGIASVAIPGLGQLLNDQMDKAAIHFVVGLGISAIGYGVGWYILPGAWYLVPTLYFAWSIYSGYDAYTVAKSQGFTLGFVPNGGIGFAYNY